MPQMSPLYWDLIYLSLMVVLLLTTSKIYFSTPQKKVETLKKSSNEVPSPNNYQWSW